MKNKKRYFVPVLGKEDEFFAGTIGFIMEDDDAIRISRDKSYNNGRASVNMILNQTKKGNLREVSDAEYFLCVGNVVGSLK